MKEVLKELIPPDVPVITRYRIAISSTLLGLLWITAAAWGIFAALGIPGFAYASDVIKLRADVNSIKLDLLEERIYNAKRLWCATGTMESKRFYQQQITSMHRDYYQQTGIAINIPTCSEIGT
jgi:hypothetical protein